MRSRTKDLGIDPEFYAKSDLHVHVPAGAVPKDGPSAGVGMTTALVSLLTGVPVREDVAMTGEITLARSGPAGWRDQGEGAGGAAGGDQPFVLPQRNEVDLDELPQVLKDDMTFVLASTMDDALKAVMPEEFQRRLAAPDVLIDERTIAQDPIVARA